MKNLFLINIIILMIVVTTFIVLYVRVQIKQKIELKVKQAEATKIEYQNKINSKKPTPSIDYTTMMNIIDQCIEMEFRVAYLTDLALTNQVVITDFESDLKQLSNGVINAFSKEFLEDLSYYHPTEYIVSYIARMFKLKLMVYVRENKIGIK